MFLNSAVHRRTYPLHLLLGPNFQENRHNQRFCRFLPLFPQPFLVNEDYEDKEEAFCPPTIKIKLKTIPYFTRMIKVDRVGFEPTTSAMPAVDRKRIISRMTITKGP
jgi:hypothetical protein